MISSLLALQWPCFFQPFLSSLLVLYGFTVTFVPLFYISPFRHDFSTLRSLFASFFSPHSPIVLYLRVVESHVSVIYTPLNLLDCFISARNIYCVFATQHRSYCAMTWMFETDGNCRGNRHANMLRSASTGTSTSGRVSIDSSDYESLHGPPCIPMGL